MSAVANPKPEGSNQPEPQTSADRITVTAIEEMDGDKVELASLSDDWIKVRGVRFNVANGASNLYFPIDGDIDRLKRVAPSAPFRELFMDSYLRYVGRRRQEKILAVEERMMAPPVEPYMAPRRRSWLAGNWGALLFAILFVGVFIGLFWYLATRSSVPKLAAADPALPVYDIRQCDEEWRTRFIINDEPNTVMCKRQILQLEAEGKATVIGRKP